MKRFFEVFACIACFAAIGAASAIAMPAHEVYMTKSGICKKVLKEGKPLSEGCKLVKAGKITRYETTYVSHSFQ